MPHFRSLDHRNVQFMRARDFGILGRDGGAGHDHFRIRDVFGAMAFQDSCAKTGEALRHRRTFQVRARDLIAEVQQNFGNAAHPNAADAYEMDTLNFCEHGNNL
jgi:hypothetical protein